MSILPSWFRSTCLQTSVWALVAARSGRVELDDVGLLVPVGVGCDDLLAAVVAAGLVDRGGHRRRSPDAASAELARLPPQPRQRAQDQGQTEPEEPRRRMRARLDANAHNIRRATAEYVETRKTVQPAGAWSCVPLIDCARMVMHGLARHGAEEDLHHRVHHARAERAAQAAARQDQGAGGGVHPPGHRSGAGTRAGAPARAATDASNQLSPPVDRTSSAST